MRTILALLMATAWSTALPAQRPSPTLHLSPDTVRVDEPFAVRVSALAPGRRATLRLRLAAPDAMWETGTWVSHATYEADAGGGIDVATTPALTGSYTGIEPMGLVWSAVRDTARGAPAAGAGLERVDVALEVEGRTAASATLWRRRADPAVRVSPVSGPGLAGTLHLPARPGRYPGVLVLGGSECGVASARHRAGLLAARGYAALAMGYCAWPDSTGAVPPGQEGLARGVFQVPVEAVDHGLRLLASSPEVDPARLGVWGLSKGAELALLAATEHPELRAVVAVVPSHVTWAGIATPWRPGSSWTSGGTPVPFVPYSRDSALVRRLAAGGRPNLSHTYRASLLDTASVRLALIPVERITAPILLVSGEEDMIWPSAEMAEMIVQRVRAHGGAPPRHLRYPRAGHAIAPPYYPTTEVGPRLGGTARDNFHAQEDAWRQILAFLGTTLGPAAPR